jgi:ribosomal protein S18 acetylase RimI-like enzyme
VALHGRNRLGLLTYRFEDDACEIVSLNALTRGRGVGTALLSAAREVAADAGCRRIWLVTTNDNTPAMRFYERRGFRQSAVYRDALDRSRVLKPEIPEIGLNGVPIRDEIEYEILLAVTDSPGE